MTIEYFQKGFNYGQDGPGNRLVYHLAGCNMRCPWCSNPEGMSQGRAGNRREDVEAVARAVIAAKPMFFDGGGLTLTGGEATNQFDAVKELLERVKAEGVHTALETNGTNPRLPELSPLADQLIMDFKHPFDQEHLRWTGLSNEAVKENLLRAAEAGVHLLIRIPLIHGVNDQDATLLGFCEYLKQFSGRARVEVLRYHEYGRDKWQKLGMDYRMEDAFLPAGRAEALEKMLKAEGLDVVRT
jgi:pyruvate formate lyase activating enzyme